MQVSGIGEINEKIFEVDLLACVSKMEFLIILVEKLINIIQLLLLMETCLLSESMYLVTLSINAIFLTANISN